LLVGINALTTPLLPMDIDKFNIAVEESQRSITKSMYDKDEEGDDTSCDDDDDDDDETPTTTPRRR
jgi:hypothetical protein